MCGPNEGDCLLGSGLLPSVLKPLSYPLNVEKKKKWMRTKSKDATAVSRLCFPDYSDKSSLSVWDCFEWALESPRNVLSSGQTGSVSNLFPNSGQCFHNKKKKKSNNNQTLLFDCGFYFCFIRTQNEPVGISCVWRQGRLCLYGVCYSYLLGYSSPS